MWTDTGVSTTETEGSFHLRHDFLVILSTKTPPTAASGSSCPQLPGLQASGLLQDSHDVERSCLPSYHTGGLWGSTTPYISASFLKRGPQSFR